MDYHGYLQSPEWAELRKFKLQQTGYRCQGCGDNERLEVHHLSYKKLGHERPEELMVLCHLCHMHEHRRAPRIGPIAGPTVGEFQRRNELAWEQKAILRTEQLRPLVVELNEAAQEVANVFAEDADKHLREKAQAVARICKGLASKMQPHSPTPRHP